MSRLLVEAVRGAGFGPVSLELSAGECVCISGPSGCGKTRLLRAIADLDEHGGSVLLDAIPQESIPPPEWRRRVGLLPAESHWWFERMREHLKEVDRPVLAALGLEPDLLDAPVARLSSGERQRFALLRLLANAPEVLLLDEPTANLDPAATRRVEALVEERRARTGLSVLWVSHDTAQIHRLGARHLCMNAGRLRKCPATETHVTRDPA